MLIGDIIGARRVAPDVSTFSVALNPS